MDAMERRILLKGASLGLLSFTLGGVETLMTPGEARARAVPFRMLNADEAETLEAVGEALVGLLTQRFEELPDAGKHRCRQIIGEQTRGDLTATIAHGVGESVDPVSRYTGVDEDRARDLAVGQAIGGDPRSDHADVP